MNSSKAQADYIQGHEIGYKAYFDGNFRSQNPFDCESQYDLWTGWLEGYMDAKEDDKK